MKLQDIVDTAIDKNLVIKQRDKLYIDIEGPRNILNSLIEEIPNNKYNPVWTITKEEKEKYFNFSSYYGLTIRFLENNKLKSFKIVN